MKTNIRFVLLICIVCASLAMANVIQETHGIQHKRRKLLEEEHDRDQEFDSAVLDIDNPDARPRHTNPDTLDNTHQQHIDTRDDEFDTAVIDKEKEHVQPSKNDQINEEKRLLNPIQRNDDDDIDAARQQHQQNIDDDEATMHSNDDAFAQGVLAERKVWQERMEKNSMKNRRHRHDSRFDSIIDNSAYSNDDDGVYNDANDDDDASHTNQNADYQSIPLYEVMIMTVMMAAAAGIGALPFFFVRTLSKRWSAVATAIACGVMFAASFDLIHEGQPYGGKFVVLGIFLGGLFIRMMQHHLNDIEDVHFGAVRGNRARRLVLMIGIMAAHAVGEGCGVGVSFVGERGWTQGVLTTLAIGVHNVPEGLAKATVLVSQGATARSALFWSIATCLPQPLVAIPSFLFVEGFRALLPVALGFAAGCMIWMVFAELLPDALEHAAPAEVASAATIAAAALEGIRMAFEGLESSSGTFQSPLDSLQYEDIGAAAIGAGAQIVAAGAAGVFIGKSSLPTPVLFGFSAIAAAVSGLVPLSHQLFAPSVPLLHTVSAAVAGAAAALLLRRHILHVGVMQAAADATAKSKKLGVGGAAVHHHKSSDASLDSLENAVYNNNNNNNIINNNSSSTNGNGAHGVWMRRSEGATPPDSPSKVKSSAAWNDLVLNHAADDLGKEFRRFAGPSMAMGTVVAAAVLAQAVSLGWLFTQYLLSAHIASNVTLPATLAMAIRGLVAGGAVRAALGRSSRLGGLLGAVVGMLSAVSMLTTLTSAEGSNAEAIQALRYPQGWTDTLGSAASGAMCMASLMEIGIAMSLNARHARFGVLLGGMVFGVLYASLFVACNVAFATGACSTLAVAF